MQRYQLQRDVRSNFRPGGKIITYGYAYDTVILISVWGEMLAVQGCDGVKFPVHKDNVTHYELPMKEQKETCYLCGKTTGETKDALLEKFEQAGREVHLMGKSSVSPLSWNFFDKKVSIEEKRKECIKQMFNSHNVYVLKDYKWCPNAMVEHDLAVSLGFPIIYQPE